MPAINMILGRRMTLLKTIPLKIIPTVTRDHHSELS